MKTTDFSKTISSKQLLENLEKQFETRVNLNKYDREQLEDMRNKLRTRIFQQEGTAKFNDLLTHETYQKDKAMLELLNTRIKEMLGEQMKQLRDKMDALNEGKKEQTGKKKCPPMSHVKKMCQDGKTVAEICKMHPDCDHKELKQMIADCKDKMDEGKMPMKTVNGKKVPAFAADGKGKNDLTKKKDDKVKEELKGGQKKLDVNKNGKLDSDDFKKLRAGKKKDSEVDGKEYDVKEGASNAESNHVPIGQQMANDGITYSPEKEREIIGLMAQYMKKDGMSPKSIRYYLNYDEDYIPDQLSYLPRAGKDGMKALAKEGFPTVDDAKARHEKEKGTGAFDKKDTGTGTVYTRKGGASGTEDPRRPAKSMKLKKGGTMQEGHKHDADCGCSECMIQQESAFSKLEKKLSHQKGVTNPAGLAAKIGRDKYGKKGMEKKAAAGRKKANESMNFKHNVRFVNESINFLLQEDEEGKAKTITAAGDIVNDFTSWMQRVGQYQTKAIIELADSIRADFGAAEAEAFKQSVSPALSDTLETLTQQREAISNAVAQLAGESVPENPMGQEPDLGIGMEPGMDKSSPDDMNPAGDEFSASDAAAGGPEASGREMRESHTHRRARKLAEEHIIISKLSR